MNLLPFFAMDIPTVFNSTQLNATQLLLMLPNPTLLSFTFLCGVSHHVSVSFISLISTSCQLHDYLCILPATCINRIKSASKHRSVYRSSSAWCMSCGARALLGGLKCARLPRRPLRMASRRLYSSLCNCSDSLR